jgi:hypothetical protein
MVQHVGDRAGGPTPFRIEGDEVVYSVPQVDGSISEQRHRYEITGNTLTFIHSPTTRMRFERMPDA